MNNLTCQQVTNKMGIRMIEHLTKTDGKRGEKKMAQYDDGSVDIYTCPYCNEDYMDFEDMKECYKGHYEK